MHNERTRERRRLMATVALISAISLAGSLWAPAADAQGAGTAAIGDRVWTDTNANGAQDSDEVNLGSATIFVNLLRCDGQLVGSQATNFAGDYGFNDLDAGCYMVEFVSPQGLPLTSKDEAADTLDSDADPITGLTDQILLADGELRTDVDAGFRKRTGPELGDRFWEDLNANGVQDPGEPGIPGVTVSLMECGGSGQDTVITDANGMYLFNDIARGCYIIEFTPPDNCIITQQNAGNDDLSDSDIDPNTGRTGEIDLEQGESDRSNDGGCYFAAALGDFLWNDLNRDGVQDANEPGITDKLVVLLDANMQPTGMSTTTDSNGFYLFDNLTPGVYFVQFMAPDGFVFTQRDAGNDDTRDSDVGGTGKSAAVELQSEETNLTVDAGAHVPAGPAIMLEKSTNGMDADNPTGPLIPLGEAVIWEYEVSNTGNVPLFNLMVTDDQGVDVICPGTALAVGDSMTCTATGTAEAGQYENLGEACADSSAGEVCDSDPSHYFGADPGIDIEKATNGEDADNPPGPSVAPGSTVTWTYLVTNTGNVALTNVQVSDDQGVTVACPRDELDVNESMTCMGQGTAVAGQYANIGTACGDSVVGQTCDDDPSHYNGALPAIDIEKATNGRDADNPRGPILLLGSDVTWTYLVTNTGQVTLSNVLVNDDQGVSVTCPGTVLAPGASMSCVGSGTATLGQYANTGTVCGNTPDGEEVCDEDPSHYFGVAPGVDIRKNLEGPDVITYVSGDTATFDITVTNTGNLPLRNLVISDPLVPACERTIAVLPPGGTESYTCAITADVGFNNEICVDATGAGIPVNDCDTSEVEVINIDIRKQAEGPDSQTVPSGGTVTWQIVVTNTGSADLEEVQVTDQMAPQCDTFIGDLAVGDSFAYACSANNVLIGFTNVAKVTGERGERMVMDDDPSQVIVQQQSCALDVDMTCQVVPPPNADLECEAKIAATRLRYIGPTILGATVEFEGKADGVAIYTNVDLISGQTVLTDQNGYSVDAQPRDLGSKMKVFINGVEEEHHTSCSTAYIAGQPAPLNQPKGEPSPNWFIEGFVDKQGNVVELPQPLPPAQSCEFAGPNAEVIYNYKVTNVGAVDATSISVIDSLLGAVPGSPIGTLAPGEMATLMSTTLISATTTSSVTVTGNSGSTDCEAQDTVTVTQTDPNVTPLACRMTGGGVDTEGNWDHTLVDGSMVRNGVGNLPDDIDRYTIGGQAGASTALPPNPSGEWTHHQQKGPSGMFTFHGGTSSAPEGTQIVEIRCNDANNCEPARDAPAKQLDFDGIGTFKNIGHGNKEPIWEIADATVTDGGNGNHNFDGTFHWFEVNIDDLGEPGNLNDGAPDPTICPDTGFGEKGAQELANCECPDFYRITIYDGVFAEQLATNGPNKTDVIYQVYGYLDGGNLQIHPPTGNDTN